MSKEKPESMFETIKAKIEHSCYVKERIEDKSCPFGLKKVEPRCQFCTRYHQKQINVEIIK